MRRVLVAAWGNNGSEYVGKEMVLFRDPKVTWGGTDVGGIRIAKLSHIKGKLVLALTATRGNKKPYVVEPLALETKGLDADAIRIAAFAAAHGGTEAIREHWKSLGKAERAVVSSQMDELKAIAAKADNPPDHEPEADFDDGNITDAPTEEVF
jgi:hypothetical protein